MEQMMENAKQQRRGNQLSTKLLLARQTERQALHLARDVKTLTQWLQPWCFRNDRFSSGRTSKVTWLVAEVRVREAAGGQKIQALRIVLEKQRDDLLAFAKVLDQKLANVAHHFETPFHLVRTVCLLHRRKPTSNTYWQRWNQLHHQLCGKFHRLLDAVGKAIKATPRASSLIKNLKSRLRNYFFLRRQLGSKYLDLL